MLIRVERTDVMSNLMYRIILQIRYHAIRYGKKVLSLFEDVSLQSDVGLCRLSNLEASSLADAAVSCSTAANATSSLCLRRNPPSSQVLRGSCQES